jgi:hypothetical protein
VAVASGGQNQVPTTVEDFFQPGTQPEPNELVFEPIVGASPCSFCHAEYLPDPQDFDEPWDAWVSSMKGQAARDPVWHAALAIANQDANQSGEYCIRCHSPSAWLGGRSLPSDASGFIEQFPINDFDGISCHFCHRAVNPVLEPDSPAEDASILAALEFPPGSGRGNGRYVVDPDDVRRGPFDDVPDNLHDPVPIIPSAFHRKSEICATCHDLGNPAYLRKPDGTYVLEDKKAGHGPGMPHPTQDPHDMFPEQRTYSEWLNSEFATDGVLFTDGRFGGNHPTGVMKECQDCHMPDQFTGGCFAYEFPPFFERPDMPQHSFAGANTWVLRALRALYDDGDTGLTEDAVIDAEARAYQMLRAASDLQVEQTSDTLTVRVINWSGHKLPSGYPEGRRMWLNVRFLDDVGMTLVEHGAYDVSTGDLTSSDTKVYQAVLGIDDDVAAATNLPAGQTFRLVLANEYLLDNRIPPVGFTNAAYEAIRAAPVNYTYADGQHWDDTDFPIPPGAVEAVVTLNYQPMTKEYIEFLRDANQGEGLHEGQIVYDLWDDPLVGNKVPPVDMDMVTVPIVARVRGDVNGDGLVNFADLLEVLSRWGPCPPQDLCPADLTDDGLVGFQDLIMVLSNWS